MNREIKFRAWHFKANKMFSAEEIAEDQLTLLPTGKFINVSGSKTTLSVVFDLDVMLPLQFTGLRVRDELSRRYNLTLKTTNHSNT